MSVRDDVFTYQPLHGGEIRVVEVAPGAVDDPIYCKIKHMKLGRSEDDSGARYWDDDRPKDPNGLYIPPQSVPFIALSYVWGDMSHRQPILVDGKRLDITRNLHEALIQIRELGSSAGSPDLGLTGPLWIDAICINQNDLEERSKQVPRMREIYSFASQVVVWLGPNKDSDEDDMVRDMFDRISTTVAERTKILQPFSMNNRSFYEEIYRAFDDYFRPPAKPDEPSASSIWDFFQRPWFERIWVVQESILPFYSPIVISGQHSAPLDGLLLYLTALPLRIQLDNTSVSSVMNANLLMGWRRETWRPGAANVYSGRVHNAVATELYQILSSTAGRKSGIPHDALYGVLGIADVARMPSHLTPDYNLPFEEVYRQFGMFLFTETGDLSFRQTRQRHLPATVPSWVPDFRYPPIVFAVSLTRPTVRFSQDESVMFVDGVGLGTIQGVVSWQPDELLDSLATKAALEDLEQQVLKPLAQARAASIGSVWQEWSSYCAGDGSRVPNPREPAAGTEPEAGWESWAKALRRETFFTDSGLMGFGQQDDKVITPGDVLLNPESLGLIGFSVFAMTAVVLHAQGDYHCWVSSGDVYDISATLNDGARLRTWAIA